MHIPGLLELTDREEITKSMILLTGNSNVGKSCYSREYLLERINDGSDCVFISCTNTEEQFQNWMLGAGVSRAQIDSSLHFINPYIRRNTEESSSKLPWIISEIKEITASYLGSKAEIPNLGSDREWNRTEHVMEKK